MSITIIVAIGEKNELGKNNGLIWHIKEDLKFFKKHSMGKPCVMGLNTFYSLPKMLPGRKHIVLSDVEVELPEGVEVFHDMDSLKEYIKTIPGEVMIIGGASMYRQFLPLADKMLITEIHATSDADVYFPEFDKDDWNRTILYTVEENGLTFDHVEYTRK